MATGQLSDWPAGLARLLLGIGVESGEPDIAWSTLSEGVTAICSLRPSARAVGCHVSGPTNGLWIRTNAVIDLRDVQAGLLLQTRDRRIR